MRWRVAAEELPGQPAEPVVVAAQDLGERVAVTVQDPGDELAVGSLHHKAHTYTTGTYDVRHATELPVLPRTSIVGLWPDDQVQKMLYAAAPACSRTASTARLTSRRAASAVTPRVSPTSR